MKLWTACFLLLLTATTHAQDGFPATCKAVTVRGETLTLEPKQAGVFLIQNLSSSDIWITHPVSEPSASAGWSTRLEAGNWSALTVEKKPFELSCIESRPGHEQQIACEGVIAVCSWDDVKLPANANGTFWAGENMTLPALTAELGGRGYTIPTTR